MSERRFAVLIGCGEYPNEPKLQDLGCPVRDVEGLAESLREKGEFAAVSVVKNAPHHRGLLEINRTLKRAAKNDLVFLYYSGHGKLDLANRLYLCATDTVFEALEATAMPVRSIREYIDVSPCHRVALVLDCCFSGAVGNVFARSGIDDQLQQVSQGRGTYIMTASTGVQVAIEKEEDQYSVFTKHLIRGLDSEEADVNEDGIVTMDELYQYVHDRVLQEGFQEPMKWAINVRGDLIIARTGRSPREERRARIRQKLMAWATEGSLPDRVFIGALGILAKDPDELRPEEIGQMAVLERLDSKDLPLGRFLDEWFTAEPKVHSPKRTDDAQPERPMKNEIETVAEAPVVETSVQPAGAREESRQENTLATPQRSMAISIIRGVVFGVFAAGLGMGAAEVLSGEVIPEELAGAVVVVSMAVLLGLEVTTTRRGGETLGIRALGAMAGALVIFLPLSLVIESFVGGAAVSLTGFLTAVAAFAGLLFWENARSIDRWAAPLFAAGAAALPGFVMTYALLGEYYSFMVAVMCGSIGFFIGLRAVLKPPLGVFEGGETDAQRRAIKV